MTRNFKTTHIFVCFLMVAVAACSKSDDQREFENQALSAPGGITETNSNGEVTGNSDPDDWQVGPMYRGLIELNSESADPPHPNPLPYNDNLTIQIEFNVSDPVDAISIRKFRLPSDPSYPELDFFPKEQLSTFNTITIGGQNIAEGPGSEARTLYRILIYDGNQNLISYGDVEIQ